MSPGHQADRRRSRAPTQTRMPAEDASPGVRRAGRVRGKCGVGGGSSLSCWRDRQPHLTSKFKGADRSLRQKSFFFAQGLTPREKRPPARRSG